MCHNAMVLLYGFPRKKNIHNGQKYFGGDQSRDVDGAYFYFTIKLQANKHKFTI